MDLTFWLLWVVLFAAAMLLVYKLVPARRARQGSEGPEGMRQCPSCRAELARSAAVCPSCGAHSTAWVWHRGNWWVRDGDAYLWLDEKHGEWRRYRRASACPYCRATMAVHERRCEDRKSVV